MDAVGALRLSPLRRGLAIDSTVDIFTFYVPHRHVYGEQWIKFMKDGVNATPLPFFFQADDGIRDLYVTGVQTCALPILRGLRLAENDFSITARFIICGLRQLPPETSLDLAKLAVEFKNDGVVAFDLAGGEKGNPASCHAAAFMYAREHNLAVTVHAGEGDGPESIREAVHVCGANRIGHGTRLIEDPELTQYVNDRRIALEVCLTSNVQTRVADSYATHPVREYFDRGLNVTLNTDNRLMSATTLTDEYVFAAEHLGFTVEELAGIALNGFESAFLPWEDRLMLIEEVSESIDELLGPVDGSGGGAA